jgi:[ribosomal protein S5]-alanine N-acetyltransferase
LRFIGDRGVRNADDARAYLRERVLAHEARHGFALGMVALRDGTPIGMCGLIRRDTLPDVDLGYAFLPAYRGQGFAREAAAAWLAHGFGALGLPRIVAFTDPDNTASCRVLEAIGMRFEKRFRLEGYARDSLLYAAGRPA